MAAFEEDVADKLSRAVVLNDAARQVKFNGQGRDLTDVLFEASISTGNLVCEYDENVLDVDLEVQVVASRGRGVVFKLLNRETLHGLAIVGVQAGGVYDVIVQNPEPRLGSSEALGLFDEAGMWRTRAGYLRDRFIEAFWCESDLPSPPASEGPSGSAAPNSMPWASGMRWSSCEWTTRVGARTAEHRVGDLQAVEDVRHARVHHRVLVDVPAGARGRPRHCP